MVHTSRKSVIPQKKTTENGKTSVFYVGNKEQRIRRKLRFYYILYHFFITNKHTFTVIRRLERLGYTSLKRSFSRLLRETLQNLMTGH